MSDSDSEEEIGALAVKETTAPSSGLFDDSDSDSEPDIGASSAPKETTTTTVPSEKKEPKKKRLQKKSDAKKKKDSLSKKERMEALLARKRSSTTDDDNIEQEASTDEPKRDRKKKEKKQSGDKDKGYESGDSYNSGGYVERTQADFDFIDNEGEDPDALRELYAEQHFEDERATGSDSEEEGRRRRKKSSGAVRKRGPDALSDVDDDDDCPVSAIVKKMKRKKKDKKKLSEVEEEAKEFLHRMDGAADEDEKSYQERKPATKKLAMLPSVLETLANKEMTRSLLDWDLLSIIKRWIQPLPNGKLGNVTVRQRLLDSIKNMTGEQGISPSDLKRSSLGKTVMALYTHRDETPNMKRQLKALIEQWSRPIFQKSGNMKDLDRVLHDRREAGLTGIARAQQATTTTKAAVIKHRDVDSTLSGKNKQVQNKHNRVRVPYSKGFQFTIRPADRISKEAVKEGRKRVGVGGADGAVGRDFISKRITDKGRKFSKNQRSANISVEGRATK